MSQHTLLWFKRDLRIHDHPALVSAAQSERPLIPLYIVEPDYWQQPDHSARQWLFILESLSELRSDLATLGAPLIIRMGEVTEVLSEIHMTHPLAEIISHEETGNAWTYSRDKHVAHWCRANGIRWHELPQTGVTRRLASRDEWTSHRQSFMH